MKRKISLVFYLLILLLIFPVAVLAAPVGKISHLEGSADVTVMGKVRDLRLEDPVSTGDIIRTKSRSRAAITFTDGNVLWLAEKSRLRVTQYRPAEGQKSYVNLFRGKTRSVMTNLAKRSSFEVHTPTAVAGVRGTIFIGFFENGQSGFVFEEGKGYGYNTAMPERVVPIEAGQAMIVPGPDQPPVVRPATAAEIEKHVKDTAPTTEPQKQQEQRPSTPPATPPPAEPPPGTGAPPALRTSPPLPPPPPIPIPPAPPSTSTNFSTPVASGGFTGTLAGTINDQTNAGVIKLEGTGTPDYIKPLTGTMSDNSNFHAFLSGISSSWHGLFVGLANKEGALSFLKGSLYDPGFTGSALSAAGVILRQPGYSSTGQIGLLPDIGLPVISSVYIGESFNIDNFANSVSGYRTSTGGLVGIWSVATSEGGYGNADRLPTWSAKIGGFGYFGEAEGYEYAFLGDIRVTDDLQGRITISGDDSILYMDEKYLGLMGLEYRGIYQESGEGYSYTSVGVGTYKFAPLSFSGSVYGALLYYDPLEEYFASSGGAYGLLGGLGNLLGGTPTLATLMGYFSVCTECYSGPALLYGSGWYLAGRTGIKTPETTDDGAFNGYLVGIWNGGKIERAKAIALYVNSDTPSKKAGYLYGDVTGSYFSGLDMWTASGNLTATKPGSDTQISPDTLNYNLSYGEFAGRLAGAGIPAAFLEGSSLGLNDQRWGIWNMGVGGSYEGKPQNAKAGGDIWWWSQEESTDNGYWMGDVTFNWNDDPSNGNRLSAQMHGRFLTDKAAGTISTNYGGLLGTFQGGTWQAAGVGIYDDVKPLALSTRLFGDLYQVVPGKIVMREFNRPYYYNDAWFSPLSYETIFFMKKKADGTYEALDQARVFAFEKIDKVGQIGGGEYQYEYPYSDEYHYYPNGRWLAIRKGEGITRPVGAGKTETLIPFPEITGEPPISPFFEGPFFENTNPGVTTFGYGDYVKASESQWLNTNAAIWNGYFSGILGILPGQPLWTSTKAAPSGVTLMGEHDPYTGSQIFDMPMILTESGAGAFVGNITGIILDTSPTGANPLEGAAIGIYVDNNQKAGILKGYPYSGFSYEAINMWEAPLATLYRDDSIKDKLTTITPETLLASDETGNYTNLFRGNIGAGVNSGLFGVFSGGGYIESPVGLMGYTLSLIDQPSWGYFDMKFGIANTYSKPLGSSNSWSGSIFGSGMLGRLQASYGNYADSGYLYAGISSGSWADSRIYGNLTGEFLTHTKKGIMEGILLGTYDAALGSWQATSVGTWQKTQDVYFSSEIRGDSYQLASYKTGYIYYGPGYYTYYYDDSGSRRYGYSQLYSSDETVDKTTYTSFDIKGPPSGEKGHKNVWVHNHADDTWTFETEVFETLEAYYAAMAEMEKDPVSGEPVPFKTYRSFNYSNFNGIMAGLGNIWNTLTPMNSEYPFLPTSTTMTPTQLFMMGDIDTFDSPVFDLFSGHVTSFDPLVTTDPNENSKTPVWDGKSGAYRGFLGGYISNNSLSGLFRGLYMDQHKNVGLFYTDSALSGIFDPGVGMWKAGGNIYTYPMYPSSYVDETITTENFASKLIYTGDYKEWETGKEVPAIYPTGGSITLGVLDRYFLSIPGFKSWEIEMSAFAGSYTGAPTSWGWVISSDTPSPIIDNPSYLTVGVTEKTGNAFSGNLAGAKSLWDSASTHVMGGQIKGVFEPATSTWKAVALSTVMETGAFLDKVTAMGTDAAQRLAFEKATNIPSTEVGKATFEGIGNNLSVKMQDVTFFRFSTETDPRIWAVKNINGSYAAAPVINTPVTLSSTSGGSLTAQFIPNNWNNSQWGAAVQGGGSLNKTTGGAVNVLFTGGAAGTYTLPGETGGTFSGTGSGIVKVGMPSP